MIFTQPIMGALRKVIITSLASILRLMSLDVISSRYRYVPYYVQHKLKVTKTISFDKKPEN